MAEGENTVRRVLPGDSRRTQHVADRTEVSPLTTY